MTIMYNPQLIQSTYFRYMWGVQQWRRWLSKHHTAAAVINRDDHNFQPTDAEMPKRVQISAQTGTDGCVRKQNTDNEPFLPAASIQFSIGFHQRT